jgi:predicted PurR-regulated permease PerM
VTGTLLAGIVGALLAVPLVAFLNSTITALRHPIEETVVSLEKRPANPTPDAEGEA